MADPLMVETGLFGTIDRLGAEGRELLLSQGQAALTHNQRDGFAGFVVSLLMRKPSMLNQHREKMEKEWREMFATFPRTVDGVTRPMGEDEASGLFEQVAAGYGADLVLQVMAEKIREPTLFDPLMKLDWRVYDTSSAKMDLVLGDQPAHFRKRDGVLERAMLPLSPTDLLLAAPTEYHETEPVLKEDFRFVLVLQANHEQFRRAKEFVIVRDLGPNDAFLKFADENLPFPDGSRPSPTN